MFSSSLKMALITFLRLIHELGVYLLRDSCTSGVKLDLLSLNAHNIFLLINSTKKLLTDKLYYNQAYMLLGER